jgi:hypothetical protein
VLEFPPMTSEQREIQESSAFAITVDFVRGKGDPSRPFRTMIDLMEALGRFDRDLVRSIDVTIEPILLLEDVEAGSIKSWFISALKSSDDTALKSGDWKKIVGDYAVKGKYALLKRLDGATSVTDPKLLEGIQAELLIEAEKTNVRSLPGYAPMSRTRLAAHIADVTASLEYLDDGDSATYEGRKEQPVPFNQSLRVDEGELTELLAIRTMINDNELILKIKKPDFLGSSKWEFRYDGHAIEAKIQDYEWLDRFREDGAGVRPGGALRAMVRVEVAYDDENESLPPKYTILKVVEVLPPPHQIEPQQLRLQKPN